jgi:ATPase family associated with various cellular activities (AAA)
MTELDPRQELALLVNSQFPIIYLDTWEERRAAEILGQVAEDLNVPLYIWTVTQGLARAGGAPIYNTQEPAQVLAQIGGIEGEGMFLLKDFHKYLEQDVIVRTLRDLAAKFRRARHAILICAPVVNIPVELEREVAQFSLGLPTEFELTQQAELTVKDLCEQYRVHVQFDQDQMPALGRALLGLTRSEAGRVLTESVLETSRFDSGTIDFIRQNKSKLIKGQGVLEFLEPGGGMGSVGGLAHLKAWLEKRRAAFSKEARQFGLDPPKGILILGVQGCGKSLCAQAVAHDWNLQLLKFDASTLFEKFIGESEKNLRKSLHVAEVVAPSVLWIDEMEKMFPASGLRSEADGGLAVRIFGTFLSWMQEKKAPVFVAATSNDISALPPELLRKGRFDEIFFVDLPNPDERKTIFAIHLGRHKQDPSKFDLAQLAAAADGFSGAEIEQAVTSGLYSAFAQKCALSTELLVKEIASTYPLSVTMREKVEALRQWARERAVPAN